MSLAPVTAAIVGAGHRAMIYAAYAKSRPQDLRIVAVADPIEQRRTEAQRLYNIPEANCFKDAAALARRGKLADAVINGAMDHQHVPTSLPLLEAGYDLLVEKPFATGEDEMRLLVDAAARHNCKVMVCHVLRYAPFYAQIRQRVAAGDIGDIIHMRLAEHVSYHHMAVAYVRGKWSRLDKCGSGMLMAKCCHDLDLIAWMKSGVPPVQVTSLGANCQFRHQNAPPGAGSRCLKDCPIEPECLYSARKQYLDHPDRWRFYVWADLEHISNPTPAQREAFLRDVSPHGRCAWKCDTHMVDHQSVLVHFADASTATLDMVGGASRPGRDIHIIGARGEIQGRLSDNRFVIRRMTPSRPTEFAEETVSLEDQGDTTGAFGGHGGGDLRLVEDFVGFVRGEPPSLSRTSIEDSIAGHLLGFLAERSRLEGRTIPIPSLSHWRACANP